MLQLERMAALNKTLLDWNFQSSELIYFQIR